VERPDPGREELLPGVAEAIPVPGVVPEEEEEEEERLF
jgi:hypothetical protein